MRALSPATREHLRLTAAAGPLGSELVEFVEAVILVVAHPLGEPPAGEGAAELATTDRVIGILERSLAGESAAAEAAGELVQKPEMLAAFFQNLDLLPARHRAADAIALLVVLALSHLEETDGSPEM